MRGTTFQVPAPTELTPVDRNGVRARGRGHRADHPAGRTAHRRGVPHPRRRVCARRAHRRRRGQRPAGPHGRRRRGVRPLPARAGAPVSRPTPTTASRRRCGWPGRWRRSSAPTGSWCPGIRRAGTWRRRRCCGCGMGSPSCSGRSSGRAWCSGSTTWRGRRVRARPRRTPRCCRRGGSASSSEWRSPGSARNSCATAVSPRCTPTCAACRPRCSRSGSSTRCWTIRCSWPRAGGPRAGRANWRCGRSRRTVLSG